MVGTGQLPRRNARCLSILYYTKLDLKETIVSRLYVLVNMLFSKHILHDAL